jgi:carboxypeptidase T
LAVRQTRSAGTVDDHFYSRHLTDRSQPKILSHTLEWGEDFHPGLRRMRPIIDEITAGLLAFCLEIAATAGARKAV